jgi:hypothetical protein
MRVVAMKLTRRFAFGSAILWSLVVGMGFSAPAFGQSAEVEVWTVPSMQKVFREDLAPQAASLAPQVGSPAPTIDLAAARNETEAAQVVLRTPRVMTLTGIEASDLLTANGATLERKNIELLRVAYIYLPGQRRDYPDPLPPLVTPLGLAANQAQPLWVSIHVPEGTGPGEYRGTLTLSVSADQGTSDASLVQTAAPMGRSRQEWPTLRQLSGFSGTSTQVVIPIRLTVWHFTVPVTPSMRTAFGIQYNFVAQQHHVAEDSPAHIALKKRYYEMLVAHRISPYYLPVDVTNPSLAAPYLDDPRVTSFVIPWSEDQAALRGTVNQMRSRGWLKKGFFYVVDEAVTQAQYDKAIQMAEKIRAIDPALKIVATFFRAPDQAFAAGKTPYDLLAGYYNIWCVNTPYFDQALMAARQKLGEEGWWYVCLGPRYPYANYFVDMQGIDHRILFWQQKEYGVEGLLYWSSNWWNPVNITDPWTDIATIKDLGEQYIYGDGSLMYPGAKVGVAGPVSSIRLEIIRDGLEDYEYLAQYERIFGAVRTREMIARHSQGLRYYDRDAAKLEATRREIGEALDRAAQARAGGLWSLYE